MLSYDAPVPATNGHRSDVNVNVNGTMPVVPHNKSTTNGASSTDQTKTKHIWLVTGPAGSGKTTVAGSLATSLGLQYIEGDTFHTQANIDKMRNGIPLTDADRWDWLGLLRDEAKNRLTTSADTAGVVVTCSALKRKYRDVIRVAAYFDPQIHIHFIFLDASEDMLLDRVSKRQGHYMGANMVRSQFDILERPTPDEEDVIRVDVSQSPSDVSSDALKQVRKIIESER